MGIGISIPGSFCLYVKVSLGKALNLPPLHIFDSPTRQDIHKFRVSDIYLKVLCSLYLRLKRNHSEEAHNQLEK